MREIACITIAITVVVFVLGGCGDDGHPEGIGNACTENDQCPTNNCYLGPAGGYCTALCFDEGSTAQCPVDTVCKPIQGGPTRCLLICGSSHYCPEGTECDPQWCPEGSSCVDISDSELKGCEPNPN